MTETPSRIAGRSWPEEGRGSPGVGAAGESTELWTPYAPWTEAIIERGDWTARPIAGLGQVLIGGNIAMGVQTLAPGAREAGLWQIVEGPRYVVRMARDKALLVSLEPVPCDPGWRAEGWSATPADSAYLVFEIAGGALTEIACEGSSANIEAGSTSACVLFAGIPCMLYRTSASVARLHVENALAPYLWRWLETRTD